METLLPRVSRLLSERYGWSSEFLAGESTLGHCLSRRMKARDVSRAEDYARLLEDDSEVRALVEEVAVSESWFFRHPAAFRAAARRILDHSPEETSWQLSLGCASGEEPYSLALELLERGLPLERINIDAVDLSYNQLDRARRGSYRLRRVRTIPEDIRSRYFEVHQNRYVLDPKVCKRVRLHRGNALEFEFPRPQYRVIFCRNLLLYLVPAKRATLCRRLRRYLAPGGMIIFGSAEAPHLELPGMESSQMGQPFYQEKGTRPPRTTGFTKEKKREKSQVEESERQIHPTMVPMESKQTPRFEPLQLLKQARALADRGALKESRLILERLIQVRPDAEAFSLLGVVAEALHDYGRARECYRAALYLEPEHDEARLHQSLLRQRNWGKAHE